MLDDDIPLIMDIAVINGHSPRLDYHYKYGAYVMCSTCIAWIYCDATVFPNSAVGFTLPCGQFA